jgi:SOS-response transcriptional repressor LexA
VNEITASQRRVLEFVQSFRAQHGCSPTCLEIARNFGWKSPNAAHDHIEALSRRGFITRQPGTARTMRPTLSGAAVLGQPSALLELPPERFIALPVVDMGRVNWQGWR